MNPGSICAFEYSLYTVCWCDFALKRPLEVVQDQWHVILPPGTISRTTTTWYMTPSNFSRTKVTCSSLKIMILRYVQINFNPHYDNEQMIIAWTHKKTNITDTTKARNNKTGNKQTNEHKASNKLSQNQWTSFDSKHFVIHHNSFLSLVWTTKPS